MTSNEKTVTLYLDNLKLTKMNSVIGWCNLKKIFVLFAFFCLSVISFSQHADSVKTDWHFSGSATVTNNGISFIPTFTLGKPAAIFDLSAGRRLSFDPQLRFGLEGKPWSFLFWWHYKLIVDKRFRLRIGAHPALSFRTITISTDELPKETIVSRRYLAGEVAPDFAVAKKIIIGITYMYSRCLEPDAARNTHYLTLNSTFSNIPVSKLFIMRISPQFYYLKTDQKNGYYFSAGMNISKRNLPLSISALINKTIVSDVPGSKNFVWNVSLVYSFNNNYAKL